MDETGKYPWLRGTHNHMFVPPTDQTSQFLRDSSQSHCGPYFGQKVLIFFGVFVIWSMNVHDMVMSQKPVRFFEHIEIACEITCIPKRDYLAGEIHCYPYGSCFVLLQAGLHFIVRKDSKLISSASLQVG